MALSLSKTCSVYREMLQNVLLAEAFPHTLQEDLLDPRAAELAAGQKKNAA